MINQHHRVEKLEGNLFGALSPAGRVREVLRAKAEGNEDLASSIIGLCPVKTYSMTDFEYRLHCEGALAVFLHADSTFEKYVYGYRILKGFKDLFAPKVAAVIAHDASTLTKCAMLDIMIKGGAGDVELDPPKLDEAEEKARANASDTLAMILTTWKDALHSEVRAEWAGFDAFCQSQFHFDGWTLVKGWSVKLDSGSIWTWVQHVLSEPPPEKMSEEWNTYTTNLAAKNEAMCRALYLARLGKTGTASDT